MIRGIAFDLDETLSSRNRAFARWIDAEWQARPEAALDRARVDALDRGGFGPKEPLLAYLATCLGWPEQSFAERHARFVRGTVEALVPDRRILALLTRLSERYPLALITNGSAHAQRAKLEKLGIARFFDPLLISEEVGSKKPERAIFERLLAAFPGAPEGVLFVGDSPERDVLGARALGLTAIWVSGGERWPLGEPAPPSIRSVLDLEPLLERVLASAG